MQQISQHQHFMQIALDLAAQGKYSVSPNPMVGAVIAAQNQVLSTGFHEYAGGAHAEVSALQNLSAPLPKDAILYVTLEPCCHTGRTPPCTQAIVESGIRHVVVAALDPNPLVSGQGVKLLQEAGIVVEVGILEQEAIALNTIFFHYMQTHRPFVIAKWAISLDGEMTTHVDDDRQLTGHAAQQSVHQLREQVDAILIGAHTARKDNPRLTVRYTASEKPRHPKRIILSQHGVLPADLTVFNADLPGETLLITTNTNVDLHLHYAKCGISFMVAPADENGLIDLPALLLILGQQGISSLLIEGGRTTLQHFLAAQLIDHIEVYVAPYLIGNLSKKLSVDAIDFKPCGADFHFSAALTRKM